MKIRDGLYHRETGLPPVELPGGRPMTLRYSEHAMKEAINDPLGLPTSMPKTVEVKLHEVFEVEIENGVLTKFVTRVERAVLTRGGELHDLVLVCNPIFRGSELFVRTLWFQETNDKHRTLDKSKYTTYRL